MRLTRGATTTLHEACAAGEIERVERLLDQAGSDVNAYSMEKVSSLWWYCR